MVADVIHNLSQRRDNAIVKISCAAIPETLLESELFGYERGAFTGAAGSKPGKFELADGGTLFLDEIAEMSPQLQAKLLRVLQDGRFQRLGSVKDVQVDVRVISATHVDIRKAITEGRISRGPVLPSQRGERPVARAAAAGRGYSVAGGTFPEEIRDTDAEE